MHLRNIALIVTVLIAAFAYAISVHAATVLFPTGGGTGTSTPPTYGQLLVGNSAGTYTLTATSSLGITSGSTYTATYPVTLTGSAFGLAFGTTTANSWSALQQFNGAASSTSLSTSGRLYIDDGSAAAPSLAFTSQIDMGFFKTATNQIAVTRGGQIKQKINTNGFEVTSDEGFVIRSATNGGQGAADTFLMRDAPGVFAIKNGANPNALNIYSTTTNASNYERLSFQASTTYNGIFSQALGYGVARPFWIDGANAGFGSSTPWGQLSASSTSAFPTLAVQQNSTGPAATFLGGKVGIATTSPYAQLSIGGDVVVGASAAAGTLGDLYLPKLGTAAGSFIAVDSSGKVIATTSPTGITSVAADYPLSGLGTSGSHLTLAFGTSTSNTWGGTQTFTNAPVLGSFTGLIAGNAGATYAAATSTATCTSASGISCSNFSVVGAGGSTLSLSSIPNSSLANSTVSGIALGSNLANLSATDSTLTFSGSYNGSTARTIGLNLANPNTWTGLQQFANASSTQFSAASQTFYIDSSGHIQAKDTVNAWSGVLSPTRSLALQTGTTTTWTATTTGAYVPYVIAPFAGTLRDIRCKTDASFLGVNPQINTSNTAPSYFIASTTVGKVGFTGSNTFSAGDKISINAGTTTTASATTISCTLQVTETP